MPIDRIICLNYTDAISRGTLIVPAGFCGFAPHKIQAVVILLYHFVNVLIVEFLPKMIQVSLYNDFIVIQREIILKYI